MEAKNNLERLELIVEQMGEAIIAASETVERLAERVDELAIQVQNQGNQVQQQSYQIFALSESLQTFIDSQAESKAQIDQLTSALKDFVIAIKNYSRDSENYY
jgi:ABC-type transporter Mla subunit MlaD